VELQSALEERVVQAVGDAKDELVGLTAELVACDTTARRQGDRARRGELQRLLAARLRRERADGRVGAEPTGDGDRFVPAGLDFAAGRSSLRSSPAPAGRNILLNGHIDAVDVEPRDQWLSTRSVLTERDGTVSSRRQRHGGGIAGLVSP
jgi:acetylornithine deacetylase/succinyl-diaminopimelate desuccinylase-like protein